MNTYRVRMKSYSYTSGAARIAQTKKYIDTQDGWIFFFGERPQDIYDLLGGDVKSVEEVGPGYTADEIQKIVWDSDQDACSRGEHRRRTFDFRNLT